VPLLELIIGHLQKNYTRMCKRHVPRDWPRDWLIGLQLPGQNYRSLLLLSLKRSYLH
jgi:hypothetical protein